MSYIEKNLVPGERILVKGAIHRIVLVIPVLMVTGVGAVLLVLAGVVFSGLPDLWRLLAGAAGLFLVLTLVGAVVGGVQVYLGYFLGQEVAVTSHRLIIKMGVIRRHHMEFTFRQIESIAFSQSLLDRLVGGAQIKVLGAGAGWVVTPILSNYQQFRQAALKQVEAVHGQAPAPSAAPASVAAI